MSHWCCACHATSRCNAHATYSLHQPPRPTLQRYQDASIDCACHQMSHWCCACHATSRCNAHATYSLHQPPRPTLQRYQDASIDCACHQMSHWCCATASHCNAPFPAPATQSHAPTLPGCFNHLPPNVTLVLRLPHNVTLQRTCNVPFPAPATQSHAPTLPGCFNRLRLPPNVTLVLRLPHNVTIQRTIPCTSHTATGSVTCTSEPISRVQASQFHVYKRTRALLLFTCAQEFKVYSDKSRFPSSNRNAAFNWRILPTATILTLPRVLLAKA